MISERYVFCSDESIKSYLLPGIRFLQRDPSLDEANTNFTQIFTSFYSQVDADIYVYAHATAPYVTLNSAQECLDKVVSGENDSSFCAVKIQDFLWQNGKPLNFDASNLPRSQDLPTIYRETSGVYVFTKEVFKLYKRRIGKKPFIKEVNFKESIDINNKEDFIIAEQFWNIL